MVWLIDRLTGAGMPAMGVMPIVLVRTMSCSRAVLIPVVLRAVLRAPIGPAAQSPIVRVAWQTVLPWLIAPVAQAIALQRPGVAVISPAQSVIGLPVATP